MSMDDLIFKKKQFGLDNPMSYNGPQQADPSLGAAQMKFGSPDAEKIAPPAQVQSPQAGNSSGISAAAQVAGGMSSGNVLGSSLSGAAAGSALAGGAVTGIALGAGVGAIGAIASAEAKRREEQRNAQRASLMQQSAIYQKTGENEASQIQNIINGLRGAYLR